MIWIVTLCLLFVAAWLFFNAMNEREWVQAHIHDDLVAADKGLFPALDGLTGGAGAGRTGDALSRAVDMAKNAADKRGKSGKTSS
ncbi:MAG: hypothetical protein CSB44_09735 [Gammaproteobacteria bacterium]|nr:MAG: hypothetical protein CSB44_09735 [Gammaproteobacteria bacterium]PIE36363.1 MAG: hypothetical protein CSA54_04710 [Gammaproteobacteria bacterium]